MISLINGLIYERRHKINDSKTMSGISLNFQKVQNELDVNGFLRLNVTQMEISNDIKLDLLPRVVLRKTTLIIKRHFHMFQRKIH